MPTLPQIFFVDLVCEAVLYGVYLVVFCAAAHLMISRRKRTWVNITIMALLFTMFGISTAYFVLSVMSIAEPFLKPDEENQGEFFLGLGSSVTVVQMVLEGFNCVIGDSIVIWRAWVICNRKFWILAIPVCLLCGTTFCAFALAYEASLFDSSSTGTVTGGFAKFSFAFGALTFATNAFMTSVIAYHTWMHHRFIKTVLSIYTNPYRKLLLLLIESGGLYCVTWLVSIVLLALQSPGIYIMNDMAAQLTGIYPTLIIVLVCLELTHPTVGKNTDSSLRSSQLPRHTSHSVQFRPNTSVASDALEVELGNVDSIKTMGSLRSEET